MQYRNSISEIQRPSNITNISDFRAKKNDSYKEEHFPLASYISLGFALGFSYLGIKENILWGIPAVIFGALGLNGLREDKDIYGSRR